MSFFPRNVDATHDGNMSIADKSKLDTDSPSTGEKGALAGTFGTPGPSNAFVTDTDPRIAGLGDAELATTLSILNLGGY